MVIQYIPKLKKKVAFTRKLNNIAYKMRQLQSKKISLQEKYIYPIDVELNKLQKEIMDLDI